MKGALSVQEAARLLGVSGNQVGRLIQAGELEAERFGPVWAVDPASVRRRASVRPMRGRPLSAQKAWELLRDASADRLALEEVIALAVASRRRADRQLFRALPALLDEVLADPRVVVSGAAAAERLGAAIAGQPPHDLYVRRSDLAGLVASHRLRNADGDAEPNLRIRVVDEDAWPFDDGARLVWPLVAAVDLVDGVDHRSAAEILQLIGRS